MSDEPGHKAMLYFLEVLMNSNGPLTVSQLAGRFGSRSFSADMRSAAGGNEAGLKKFLLKYPSLFTVKGNMVSLFDGKSTGDTDSDNGKPEGSTPSVRPLPDVSVEMEAVQFFQGKLTKKEERWVHIKSLAGHLSQASSDVRNVVGPQLDFRRWLLKHPHIFEVQGELVGLRDGIAAVATPTIPRRLTANYDPPPPPVAGIVHTPVSTLRQAPPPKTPPAQRRQLPPKTPPTIRRSHSFSEKRAQQIMAAQVSPPAPPAVMSDMVIPPPSTPGSRRRGPPVTMTANEYKAVMYLKDIIEKKGAVRLHNITGHFSQAAEGVRNTIGWTKTELEDFLKKNANVFSVSGDEVTLVKNAKLNVVITGSRPQAQNLRVLQGRKGKVFHVAKLWGIIDLGKHEHVFFDKSIMVRPLDDLQLHYKIGETLYFNAVLAQKSSRAKWRATRVWKESEQEPSDNDSEVSAGDYGHLLSPSMSIEDEINMFLPQQEFDPPPDTPRNKYSDAAPSAAGVVPVWNFRGDKALSPEKETDTACTLSMVPESYQMSSSTITEQSKPKPPKALVNGVDAPPASKYVSVSCQTVSTGDIIATELYQEASFQ